MCGEFDALCFTARKGCGRLAQTQIAESDVVQHAQAIGDLRHFTKERDRLAHCHTEHFVNVLAAITNVENLLLETRAFALFANQFNVREKLHLNRNRAVSLTDLTTPARKIERKV